MLKKVDLDTTGKFRCEISGEAPLFQTAYKDAVMAVVGKSMTWKSITQMMLLYKSNMIGSILYFIICFYNIICNRV